MKGIEIVCTSNPKGTFRPCILQADTLPGTIMEVVPGVNPVQGVHTWRASTLAQGRPRVIAVLCNDWNQGQLWSTTLKAGQQGILYFPLYGEDMNMIVDVPGTGTSAGGGVTVGELLEANPDGHLTNEVSTTAGAPFVSMEALPDIALNPGGTLMVWCMRQ